jgi:hypothetical protein
LKIACQQLEGVTELTATVFELQKQRGFEIVQ